eukprot:15482864-Alexandrium_andersonii.AAC.1
MVPLARFPTAGSRGLGRAGLPEPPAPGDSGEGRRRHAPGAAWEALTSHRAHSRGSRPPCPGGHAPLTPARAGP